MNLTDRLTTLITDSRQHGHNPRVLELTPLTRAALWAETPISLRVKYGVPTKFGGIPIKCVELFGPEFRQIVSPGYRVL